MSHLDAAFSALKLQPQALCLNLSIMPACHLLLLLQLPSF